MYIPTILQMDAMRAQQNTSQNILVAPWWPVAALLNNYKSLHVGRGAKTKI